MTLPATTCLAENTDPMLRDVVAHLGSATGLSIGFDETMSHADRRRALETGEIALAWVCGLLTRELIDTNRFDADIVGAPVFTGQTSAVYHAVLVARDGDDVGSVADADGTTLAINEAESWSGHHGFAAHLRGIGRSIGMFESTVETGSHLQSIRAVLDGDADLASIDHTVWEHIARSGLDTDRLRVIGRTDDWPAPPFSISRALATEDRRLLEQALLSIPLGQVRGLTRIEPADLTEYRILHR